jgi:DNA polymerase-1
MNFFSRFFLSNQREMENKPKLFLFDAYALIYRAYYAFINRPMINSKGVNTSAIYGFTTTMVDILHREKPDYAAVVFDPPSPTFRNNLYSEYKANRLSTPEEIIKSVPVIKSIIGAFNIPVVEINGYEADDVIGTLAKQAESKGFYTCMVTPDKDYMQLVTDQINMFKPGRSGGDYELIGVAEVNKFFGVDNPLKVIDILALWGDSSDNVPGAPGIGEKTARDLISTYHSVGNLLQHIDEHKPKQRESISQHVDQVVLSHKLVTIDTQVPLPFSVEDLAYTNRDDQKLKELFQHLEFRTLSTRLFKSAPQSPVQGSLFEEAVPAGGVTVTAGKTIENVPHIYHLVTPGVALEKLPV